MMKILFIYLLATITPATGQETDEWWRRAKGRQVESYQEFRKLVVPRQADDADEEAGSLANTHIIIEFYMQWCHFCKEFVDDWNDIVDKTEAKYNTIGADGKPINKVKFLVVDGTQQNELRRRYKVQGFPSFVYLKPGVKAKVAKSFEQQRTRESMLAWIDENVKRYDGASQDTYQQDVGTGASSAQFNQQFAQDVRAKQDDINRMGKDELEQELVNMGNSFNSAGIFLNQHLGGLEKDISAQVEKAKLFEEEYLLKQKRIGSLYKMYKDEFVRHQTFKDAAMFLLGFVGGLVATVIFVIVSMPQSTGPVRVVRRKKEGISALDEEEQRPRSKLDGEPYETYLDERDIHKHGPEETGASSGVQMYPQDDEENDSPGRGLS